MAVLTVPPEALIRRGPAPEAFAAAAMEMRTLPSSRSRPRVWTTSSCCISR